MKSAKNRIAAMSERPDSGYTLVELATVVTFLAALSAALWRFIAPGEPLLWQGMSAFAGLAALVVVAISVRGAVKNRLATARPDGGFTLTELTVGVTIILVITAIFTRVIAGDQPDVWQGMAMAAAVSIVILALTLTVNYLRGRKKSVSDRLATMSKNPEGGFTSSEIGMGVVGLLFFVVILVMAFG